MGDIEKKRRLLGLLQQKKKLLERKRSLSAQPSPSFDSMRTMEAPAMPAVSTSVVTGPQKPISGLARLRDQIDKTMAGVRETPHAAPPASLRDRPLTEPEEKYKDMSFMGQLGASAKHTLGQFAGMPVEMIANTPGMISEALSPPEGQTRAGVVGDVAGGFKRMLTNAPGQLHYMTDVPRMLGLKDGKGVGPYNWGAYLGSGMTGLSPEEYYKRAVGDFHEEGGSGLIYDLMGLKASLKRPTKKAAKLRKRELEGVSHEGSFLKDINKIEAEELANQRDLDYYRGVIGQKAAVDKSIPPSKRTPAAKVLYDDFLRNEARRGEVLSRQSQKIPESGKPLVDKSIPPSQRPKVAPTVKESLTVDKPIPPSKRPKPDFELTSEPTPTKQTKPISVPKPDKDVVWLKKSAMEDLRRDWGMDEWDKPTRENQMVEFNRAKAEGYDKRAIEIAKEAQASGRELNRLEQSGLGVKITELNNECNALVKESSDLIAKGDKAAGNGAKQELRVKQAIMDDLITAGAEAASESARNLRFKQVGVRAEDLGFAASARRMQSTKGSRLTTKEIRQVEKNVDVHAKAKAELEKVKKELADVKANKEKDIAEQVAKIEANRAKITSKKKNARQLIMVERADIKNQLRDMGYRVNDITGVTTEGSYLIGKLAINYLKEGGVSLEAVTRRVMADIPNITKRDVYRALNAKNPKAIKKARNKVHKEIRQVKTEARLLLKLDDAEEAVYGTVEKRTQPTARIKSLQKQVRDKQTAIRLSEKIDQAKRGVIPKKGKRAKPSPETKALQKELRDLETEIRLAGEVKQARRGVFRKPKKRGESTARAKELQKVLRDLRVEAYRSNLSARKLEKVIRDINDAQDMLKTGRRAIRKGKAIEGVDLTAARAKLAEIRKTMRTEDRLAELQRQLRTGDIKIDPKPEIQWKSPRLERAEVAVKLAKRDIHTMIANAAPTTTGRIFAETVNTMRTLKATADMSSTLRQLLVLSAAHPIRAGKVFGKSFVPTFSKAKAEAIDVGMRSVDHHYKRVKSGLFLPEIDMADLTKSEEMFMAQWIKRVPALGPVVRGSERHMVTSLNLMRTACFDDYLIKYPNATRSELKAWANWINVATGRGDLGVLERAANVLSLGIFAPRFAASRIQTPYMVFKHWKHPRVRKEIAKNYAALATAGTTALVLADMAGADVGLDPRSPDWGKIRIGDTRVDIWAGVQQPLRVVARIGAGATDKMGLTGEGLTDREKDIDPIDLVTRFAAFKLAPAITVPVEFYRGRSIVGEEVTPTETAIRAVLPMVVDDIRDAYKISGFGTAVLSGGLNVLGASANTYEDSETQTRSKIRRLFRKGEGVKAHTLWIQWNIKHSDRKIYGGKGLPSLDIK